MSDLLGMLQRFLPGRRLPRSSWRSGWRLCELLVNPAEGGGCAPRSMAADKLFIEKALGFIADQRQHDLLDRRVDQIAEQFLDDDFRSSGDIEARGAGAQRRHAERAHPVFGSALEQIGDKLPQSGFMHVMSEVFNRDGMVEVSAREAATRSAGHVAQPQSLFEAEFESFPTYILPSDARQGSGHAAAGRELIIVGTDERISLHFCQTSLIDMDGVLVIDIETVNVTTHCHHHALPGSRKVPGSLGPRYDPGHNRIDAIIDRDRAGI